ncbi:MAG: GspE/PulE family protein [Gammaproteobacteria bacterium]|nr:GspE/PulE family protein [Gammaproteobacteria bacterium]
MLHSAKPEIADHKLGLRELLEALIADGVVAKADAENLFLPARSARSEVHPLAQVAEQKWNSALPPHKLLTIEALTEWMAGWAKLPYYHIDPLKINVTAVTNTMSDAYAARFRILPVEVNAREVVVATAEPFLTEWEKELAPILRLEIRRVVANPLDIQRYLAEFYSLARSVKRAMQSQSSSFSGGLSNFEQLVEMGRGGNLDANDQHVVHIVDWLLQYAFDQRASDIHLEPRREYGDVRFRIDGVMHPVYQIPLAVIGAITSRIKGLGRMDIVEKRRPQDGRIKTRSPEGDEIELRLSTMPTAFGEKLVMRIFNPDVIVQSFKEMGFSDEDTARWNQMAAQPNGIILVTGPTGSGKTTTLYSTLRQLAVPEVNVCTIEDPIEMISPQLNQMQVQPNIGLDFASGVRTLMRQDPDIIMVGEIRDLETAEMAIQAALTGHLVLTTLHTNDAPSAISRLLDLGVPPYLINATLLGVLAQRLVRTLCPHCKERVALDHDTWSALVKPWKAAKPATVSAPKGCLECRMTGYLGRIGLYEMLPLSPGLRKLVTPGCDVAALREQAYKEGMKPLRISGAQKVASGLTTVDEVLKVTPPPYGL